MTHQRTRVDFGGHRDSIFREVMFGILLRAPIAGDGRKLAHDETLDVGALGFTIVIVRAVVANLRICENHYLARIRGIGEDFLVAGDSGVEDNFAQAVFRRTKAPALEDRPVLQGEHCMIQFGLSSKGCN